MRGTKHKAKLCYREEKASEDDDDEKIFLLEAVVHVPIIF